MTLVLVVSCSLFVFLQEGGGCMGDGRSISGVNLKRGGYCIFSWFRVSHACIRITCCKTAGFYVFEPIGNVACANFISEGCIFRSVCRGLNDRNRREDLSYAGGGG